MTMTIMDMNSVLDDIIDNLQPEEVPAAFIIMAKIIDMDGKETIIRGVELEAFLKGSKKDFFEVRFVLNVKKMKQAILDEFKKFKKRIDE